jgi:hypothetical protein
MKSEKSLQEGPVILFPIGGCAAEGKLTEAEVELKMATLREEVRKHWNEPGLQAAIALMEVRAARLQKNAIMKGAGEYEQGQAFGAGQMVGLMREVVSTEEEKVER